MATVVEGLVQTITRSFADFSRQKGLAVIASGVDNHGGLQWQAGEAALLNRYITVGLVLNKRDAPLWLEVWVGADDGYHFGREVIITWDVAKDAFDISPLVAELSRASIRLSGTMNEDATLGDIIEDFQLVLNDAWTIGMIILQQDSLHEEYIVPRRPSST